MFSHVSSRSARSGRRSKSTVWGSSPSWGRRGGRASPTGRRSCRPGPPAASQTRSSRGCRTGSRKRGLARHFRRRPGPVARLNLPARRPAVHQVVHCRVQDGAVHLLRLRWTSSLPWAGELGAEPGQELTLGEAGDAVRRVEPEPRQGRHHRRTGDLVEALEPSAPRRTGASKARRAGPGADRLGADAVLAPDVTRSRRPAGSPPRPRAPPARGAEVGGHQLRMAEVPAGAASPAA